MAIFRAVWAVDIGAYFTFLAADRGRWGGTGVHSHSHAFLPTSTKNARFGFRIFACKWGKDGAVGNSKAGWWLRSGVADNEEWGETAKGQESRYGKGCQREMCGR